MPRTSTIKRLPPGIKEAIDDRLKAGIPLDDIVAAVRGLGADVSRSAVGRYKQEFDKVGERLLRSREISAVFVEKLGAAPEGKQGRLIQELMQTVVFDLLLKTGSDDGDIALDPEAIMFLARSIKDLASAEKTSADRELQIRKQLVKDAADAGAKAGASLGLTAAGQAAIRAGILGIVG